MSAKLFLISVLLMISSTIFGQSYKELRSSAEEAYEAFDLPTAIELATKALAQAKEEEGASSYEFADIQVDLAMYFVYNYEGDKGLTMLYESMEMIHKIKGDRSEEYAEVIYNMAAALYMLNEIQEALNVCEEVVPLAKKVFGEFGEKYAYSLNLRGLINLDLGQYELVERDYLEVIDILEQMKETKFEEYISSISHLGDLYKSMGQLKKSKEFLTKALKACEAANETSSDTYGNCLYMIGDLSDQTGEFEKALDYFNKCEVVRKQLYGENHEKYATVIEAIAGVYKEQERYIEAEQYYIRANQITAAHVGTSHISYMVSLNNLATLYLNLGRFDDAAKLLEPIVVTCAEQIDNLPIRFSTFASNLAFAYHELGLLAEADQMYSFALSSQEEIVGKDHYDNVTLLNNIAALRIDEEKFGEANLLLDRCIKILEKNEITNTREYVDMIYSRGLNAMNLEDYKDAIRFFPKAVELSEKVYGKHHLMNATILINMGFLYDKMQDAKNAEIYYVKGMDVYDEVIGNRIEFMAPESKEELKKDLNLHFSYLKQFVLDNPNQALIGKLYDYQLAVKSMIANSELEVRKQILASNDPKLKSLFEDWTLARENLNNLYSFSSQELMEEGVDLDSISASVDLLEKDMILKSGVYNEARDRKKISWKSIQQQLSTSEAVIEIIRAPYFSEDDPIPIKYVALILTAESKGGPVLVQIEGGRKIENEWSGEYFASLFAKEEDNKSYNRFWKGIAKAVASKEKLFVSRSGIYNIMNVSTFQNPVTKEFVLDEKDIVFLGSTRDFIKMKSDNKTNGLIQNKQAAIFGYPDFYMDITEDEDLKNDLLAMASNNDRAFKRDFEMVADLPGTKKEAEKINEILSTYGWETKLFLEKDALEGTVKQLVSPSVLHIATHGFYDYQYEGYEEEDMSRTSREVTKKDPLFRSGLMMAGSGFVVKLTEGKISLVENLEDGILSGYEIINMDLSNTNLVVLSACLSGIGQLDINDTEAFAGLLQAFLSAGAKAVVTSGWAVDDNATLELMTLFYNNIAQGFDKRKALRDAQMVLKEKHPEPYFWGPFMMIGE